MGRPGQYIALQVPDVCFQRAPALGFTFVHSRVVLPGEEAIAASFVQHYERQFLTQHVRRRTVKSRRAAAGRD